MPVFQDTVARFVEAHKLAISVQARLLDLVSEVGELAKEVLQATRYGREPFQPTQDWAGEAEEIRIAACAQGRREL